MSDYIYTNGEIVKADDELMHYGVIGMKWGRRRNPSATFGKYSQKIDKLKAKSAKIEAKSQNKLSKGSNKRYLTEIGRGLAENRLWRGRRLHRKALRKDKKANKLERRLMKEFRNVSIDDISREDLIRGRNYITVLKMKRR